MPTKRFPLRPLYVAATSGNDRAHQTLVQLAISLLKKGRLPPHHLLDYLLKAIDDPGDYASRMKEVVPPAKRGRPSIDDSSPRVDLGFGKSFFGQAPSERNALMIAYLRSIGHPINAAGRAEKESAVALLSELTGRDTRSLQRDYYRHKDKLSGTDLQLDLGRVFLMGKRRLHEMRTSHAEDSSSS